LPLEACIDNSGAANQAKFYMPNEAVTDSPLEVL
jgi:hypothetical protein